MLFMHKPNHNKAQVPISSNKKRKKNQQQQPKVLIDPIG